MPEISSNVTIKAIVLFFVKSIGLFCCLYFVFNSIGIEKGIINSLLKQQTTLHTKSGQTAMFIPSEELADLDCKLIVYRPSIQPNGKFLYFNMKYLCYISMLILVSLIFATTVSWTRRILAFLYANLLMLLYIYIICGVIVRELSYRIMDDVGMDYTGVIYWLNTKIYNVFVVDGIQWTGVISIVLWILTTIRWKEIKQLLP